MLRKPPPIPAHRPSPLQHPIREQFARTHHALSAAIAQRRIADPETFVAALLARIEAGERSLRDELLDLHRDQAALLACAARCSCRAGGQP